MHSHTNSTANLFQKKPDDSDSSALLSVPSYREIISPIDAHSKLDESVDFMSLFCVWGFFSFFLQNTLKS